jgi:hypothetical protein
LPIKSESKHLIQKNLSNSKVSDSQMLPGNVPIDLNSNSQIFDDPQHDFFPNTESIQAANEQQNTSQTIQVPQIGFSAESHSIPHSEDLP